MARTEAEERERTGTCHFWQRLAQCEIEQKFSKGNQADLQFRKACAEMYWLLTRLRRICLDNLLAGWLMVAHPNKTTQPRS